jgi:hypothetical protein
MKETPVGPVIGIDRGLRLGRGAVYALPVPGVLTPCR